MTKIEMKIGMKIGTKIGEYDRRGLSLLGSLIIKAYIKRPRVCPLTAWVQYATVHG